MPERDESALSFDYTDLELDQLLLGDGLEDDSPEESDDDQPAPSAELIALGRRLSGQYVDMLAHFTRRAHAEASGSEELTAPVIGALSPLIRLNQAVDDRALGAALSALLALLEEGIPEHQVPRTRFLQQLREYILAIADHLDEADADRLRTLIHFDQATVPLLDELSKIRGIGPRRLERLYCAGLFAVAPIAAATPEEITSVTTIPLHLSAEIIRVSRAFGRARRQRCVDDLRRQIGAFVQLLPDLDDEGDQALLADAQQSLEALQRALASRRKPAAG